MSTSAVIYAKGLERMSSFYEQLLGLRAVSNADGYRVLVSGSVKLSLVTIPDAISATITLEQPPLRRTSAAIKLAFEVASIEQARAIATSFGGTIDPSSTEWSHDGLIHCDGVDPEGNVIQLVSPEPPAPR